MSAEENKVISLLGRNERSVSSERALNDYQRYLEGAKKKLRTLGIDTKYDSPAIKTLRLVAPSVSAELEDDSAHKVAEVTLRVSSISRYALVSSLAESRTFTERQLVKLHKEREAGGSDRSELDKKEQFLTGELTRKTYLVNQTERCFETSREPDAKLVNEFAKELKSQSRILAYWNYNKAQELTKTLALIHTCEQCISYLKDLPGQKVRQVLGRDQRSWVCPAQDLRNMALNVRYKVGKTLDSF